MATLYKLTNANGRTRGGTQWGPGVTHKAMGAASQDLCTDGWIHAYEHPLLAVLFNLIHADFTSPRLWEADGEIGKRDGQLKCGCRSLTTIREIPIPKITTTQRVAFAIYCGLVVYKDEKWVKWANDWLSGKDRSEVEAAAARAAATRAARAAADAAAAAARAAADAAAAAARAAAAASAAAPAAAAAWAARAAADINLIELAEKAMEVK